MPAPILQFKRGNAGVAGTVPALRPGEPAFSLNNFDFFVGFDTSVSGNKFFGSHRYWEREDGTTSLRLNLVDKDGSNSIKLKSPNTVSIGTTDTYTLPNTNTITDGYFLRVATDGQLSWGAVAAGGSFTDASFSGITTIGGTFLDVNVDTDFSGITTFSNTTNNTLGNPDTGAVQIDGGVGINRNVTVGEALSVVEQIRPSAGTATTNGIEWASDIGGGGGDRAFIKYYSQNGEDTRLHIGLANDADDDLYLESTIVSTSNDLTVGAGLSVVGTGVFSNTTNNTLGNPDTGAVQIDGGVGIAENLTVGAGLSVGGESHFIGTVTFYGGTINLGDSTSDVINIDGRIDSHLVPTTDATFDVGISTLRWRNLYFSGIGSFDGGLNITGQTTLNNDLAVIGVSTFTDDITANGDVTLGSDSSDTLTVNANTTFAGIVTFQNATLTGTISTATRALTLDVTENDLDTGSLLFAVGTGATVVFRDDQLTYDANTNTLTVANDINVGTALSAPTIKVATVQHSNGTQAATIDSAGNITASQNLTVSGNLFVNGNTTQVNTTELTVYDRTITLGITTAGTTPSTTSWDLGVLMNYGDAGVAKTAGVIWKYGNNDVERFQFATNTDNPGSGGDENFPDITVGTFAPIEVAELWINNTCSGGAVEVIHCYDSGSGSELQLRNIVVDAGTF